MRPREAGLTPGRDSLCPGDADLFRDAAPADGALPSSTEQPEFGFRHADVSPKSCQQPPLGKRQRFLRRWLAAFAVLIAIPVLWSFFVAILAPGGASDGVRSVEWVRTHGGASMVAWAEDLWYSHHPPRVGGAPRAGLIPTPPLASVRVAPGRVGPVPLVPLVGTPQPGEGLWRPVGRTVGGLPGIYATYLRPDPIHTSLVTGVAWMDPKLLSYSLYAGAQEPGGHWSNMAPIPAGVRSSLVAAFNSGFKLQDAGGGYYADGRFARPLAAGVASLVIYRNGSATVAKWGRDATMGPQVLAVRQNLPLIVDGARPVPGLRSAPNKAWGATIGNKVMVWRSGLGVSSSGALIYVAGDGLSAYSLAQVLARAGATRGMELDINSSWVDYFTFDYGSGGQASPSNGKRLVGDMMRPPQRYFEATARDFVAVLAR